MGAHNSTVSGLKFDLMDNDSLQLFSQESPIPLLDTYWDNFLSFDISNHLTREMDEQMNTKLKPICKKLFFNNKKSGNFSTLLEYVKKHSATVMTAGINKQESSSRLTMTICRLCNALFISRCYVKYLIEHTNESELLNHFSRVHCESLQNDDSKPVKFEDYLQILIEILVEIPTTDETYDLQIEVINSLLVVLSISLFAFVPSNQYAAYKFLQQFNDTDSLIRALLQFYIHQLKRPIKSSSRIFDIASDIWHFISFHRQDVEESHFQSPLANHSTLLLLVLVNHCASSSNPYRRAISSYAENVSGLYHVLCHTIDHEENTLLLYHLLHTNANFRNYFLARSDIELMLVPVLKRIYNVADNNCHHVYMSLIILLILTEDVLFNKAIHSVVLKGVSWYTDRALSEISLGGLVVLVTVKIIQYNLIRIRDKYLHTNCLAALANMSSQFSNLHPYVCQRIVSLLEILTKTHSKANVDIMAVEETIRIILEVINSSLTHQLIHNTNLVYTILYNKHIFQPFRSHEAFHDIVQNIDLVITFFSKKLEKETDPCNDVDEILGKVQMWSHQWPRDLMKKFPDLKFKYVEEEKPEEFFVPYVWSLVGKYSGIYWNSALYKL